MLLTRRMVIKLVIKRRGDAPGAPPLGEKVFNGQFITLGSDEAATVPLDGAGIEPEQAVITNREGEMLLMNSADGTMLNGESLPRAARRLLKHGDTLGMGNYAIVVLSHDETDTSSSNLVRPHAESFDDEKTFISSAPPTPVNAPPSSPVVAPVDEMSPRNFAAILDSMRTEEDRFYFLIQGGPMNGKRVPLESEIIPLGWDASGQVLSFEEMDAPRALVRKNWRGEVTVEAQLPGMVAVNGVLVEQPRHLQNGDRISIAPTAITNLENIAQLIFHEPASLAAIGALFPQEIPPPVTTAAIDTPSNVTEAQDDSDAATATTLTTDDAALTTLVAAQPSVIQSRGVALPEKKFFGYFTAGEMLMFALSTLLVAVVVFLALEFL